MKKGLLGTTALVAAAAAMTTANAEEMMAEPISISIGGHSTWGAAILGGDTVKDDEIGVKEGETGIRTFNSMKVTFAGSTVLDNGLEVGVNYKLTGRWEAWEDVVWDDIYTDVSGAFGTIRLGNSRPAAYKVATAAPYATYVFGINTPTFAPAGSLSTFAGAGKGDDVSLLYFTPSFNGLSAAASYAPESGSQFRATDLEGGHIWSIGARYDGAIGEDTSVSASAGYVIHNVAEAAAVSAKTAPLVAIRPNKSHDVTTDRYVVLQKAEDAVEERQETDMAIGLSVSMAGVSVGASYRRTDDGKKDMVQGVPKDRDDAVAYDFGLSYGMGPWAVSANYGHTKAHNDEGTDHLRILGRYSLGAGVTVTGAIGARQPTVGEDEESKDVTFGGMAIAVSF